MQRLQESFAYHLARGDWPASAVKHTRRDLGGGLSAAHIARRAIVDEFGDILHSEEESTLKLLVSELVSNAVLHGGATSKDGVILYLAVAPERIRAEVYDGGPGPDLRQLDFLQIDLRDLASRDGKCGGWGLVLVDKLASRWGVSSDDGACVWFELDR